MYHRAYAIIFGVINMVDSIQTYTLTHSSLQGDT